MHFEQPPRKVEARPNNETSTSQHLQFTNFNLIFFRAPGQRTRPSAATSKPDPRTKTIGKFVAVSPSRGDRLSQRQIDFALRRNAQLLSSRCTPYATRPFVMRPAAYLAVRAAREDRRFSQKFSGRAGFLPRRELSPPPAAAWPGGKKNSARRPRDRRNNPGIPAHSGVHSPLIL